MIEITVESKIDKIWNNEQYKNQNHWCKCAWSNIKWEEIFDMINFKITLLFDNEPNYWETSQLKEVLINLKKLKNKEGFLLYLHSENEIDKLLPDIDILIDFFEEYVEKECKIIIY